MPGAAPADGDNWAAIQWSHGDLLVTLLVMLVVGAFWWLPRTRRRLPANPPAAQHGPASSRARRHHQGRQHMMLQACLCFKTRLTPSYLHPRRSSCSSPRHQPACCSWFRPPAAAAGARARWHQSHRLASRHLGINIVLARTGAHRAAQLARIVLRRRCASRPLLFCILVSCCCCPAPAGAAVCVLIQSMSQRAH